MDYDDAWVEVIETDAEELEQKKEKGAGEGGRNQALGRASEHPAAGGDILFRRVPSQALALQ